MDPRFSDKNNPIIIRWLLVVCGLIMIMVAFGGYVRLTRSGLSIVEWNPISGIIPPLGETAWEAEFTKYQATPEFALINKNMSLEGYKKIFYAEYIHRLIARFAGLMVVVPLFYYIAKGIIPWRKSGIYLTIAALFGFQGYLGWFMVSSGLINLPSVSHYRLTLHLLTALLLLALTLWVAMKHIYQRPSKIPQFRRSSPYRYAVTLMSLLVIQIAYGGFVAGLDAGWVSNTFPLMFGRWVPRGLFNQFENWLLNLVASPLTVHFIHRWFAFVVLFAAIAIYMIGKRRGYNPALFKAILTFLVLISVQITLGATVVWFSVPIVLALSHQATALLMFVTATFILYHVIYQVSAAPVTLRELNFLPQAGD
jgi:cytochrome c oxidase assembly protein subunit 15